MMIDISDVLILQGHTRIDLFNFDDFSFRFFLAAIVSSLRMTLLKSLEEAASFFDCSGGCSATAYSLRLLLVRWEIASTFKFLDGVFLLCLLSCSTILRLLNYLHFGALMF